MSSAGACGNCYRTYTARDIETINDMDGQSVLLSVFLFSNAIYTMFLPYTSGDKNPLYRKISASDIALESP